MGPDDMIRESDVFADGEFPFYENPSPACLGDHDPGAHGGVLYKHLVEDT